MDTRGSSAAAANHRLTVVAEDAMPAALDQEIRALLCQCFPADAETFAVTRHWHGSAPAFSVVAAGAAGVVGHVGLVARTIRAGGQLVTVAGIQNFAVAAAERGAGLGPALMDAAMAEARRRGLAFGLLFCVPALSPYYERLGWRPHEGQVLMDFAGDRDVPIPGKNVCLVLELAATPFPAGDIHLQGPDW